MRPGGRVLLSTHGVYPYHPNPEDLWRWTHSGLDRLFRDNGDWSSVSVSAGAGTAGTVAMLAAHLVDLLFKRARLRGAGRPFVALLNAGGEGLDNAIPLLRQPVAGSLAANYHVEAVAS